jgi:hypothetical protein
MYNVAVYMSSVPCIANRSRKVEVLQNFYQGLCNIGVDSILVDNYDPVDANLAVILGWVGEKVNGAHLQLRQTVIKQQSGLARHTMSIDGSCFKFADSRSMFLRYSTNGVLYNSSNYANQMSDSRKWDYIKSILGIKLSPWRISGSHILVCLQRDGGWSMKGHDIKQWLEEVVKKLRKLSDRPILIRQHPFSKIDISHVLRSYSNVTASNNTTLQQDLNNAWASVFFNSSSSVASIVAGVPIFVSDSSCVSYRVANYDFLRIEQPLMPDRTQWLYDLSAAHWSDEDAINGSIYEQFLPYL